MVVVVAMVVEAAERVNRWAWPPRWASLLG